MTHACQYSDTLNGCQGRITDQLSNEGGSLDKHYGSSKPAVGKDAVVHRTHAANSHAQRRLQCIEVDCMRAKKWPMTLKMRGIQRWIPGAHCGREEAGRVISRHAAGQRFL